MSLTNYEKETTIVYNDEEKTASVYTCNKSLMRKLDKFCEVKPDLYALKSRDEHSKTYIVPKKFISIRLPAKRKEMTEEQKEIARSRFLKNITRKHKS